MTTRVKWLCDGKRQIDRFGAWVRVQEGEISDHPTDELIRVKEGVHYELAPLKPAFAEEEKSPDDAPQGAETGKGKVAHKKAASKKAAARKRGRRRVIKSKE